MRPRVFLYVQHLMGIGHLMRAADLARAMSVLDLDVMLVSGGLPHRDLDLESVRFVQLPPVTTQGTTYSVLIDGEGNPIDDAFRTKRRDVLLEHLRSFRPHLVLTEHFPFGRGKLMFELFPLLEACRTLNPRPLLFASVRDIIEPPESEKKANRFLDLANSHYDAILVHGDHDFAPLDLSFPSASQLEPKIHYTGYVGGSKIQTVPQRAKRIVISAGHGRTGGPLVETAWAAYQLESLGMNWDVKLGASFPEEVARRLRAEATGTFSVSAATPDFARDLASAALSVSQAGYNTVVDLAVSGTKAVLVPYSGHDEKEQGLRAGCLEAAGRAVAIEEKSLSPQRLLAAMTKALTNPLREDPPFRLGGGAKSAALVKHAIDTAGLLDR